MISKGDAFQSPWKSIEGKYNEHQMANEGREMLRNSGQRHLEMRLPWYRDVAKVRNSWWAGLVRAEWDTRITL